jgi:DNA end-binding protein Ku
MARPIWTGSIAFGLVNIPVGLHTAVRDSRPRFRLLHAGDLGPINLERVCQKDGKPVSWNDLVKGYEYAKGKFVVVTKDDFEAAALEKTRRIDILDFVPADAIDDRFFDRPYYLEPGSGADMAYAVLREALRHSGRIGVAKFILRNVQHLAAVEAIGDALVLSTLRFSDELVDVKTYSFPGKSGVTKKDLQLAVMLVERLAAEWTPDKYTDDYRENLMRVIKARMKGKRANLTAEERPREAQIVDLMQRLRASLDRARSPRGRAGRATRTRRSAGPRKRPSSHRRAA